MNELKNSKRIFNVIRWVARIFGAIMVCFLWFMLFAHLFGEGEGNTPMFREAVSMFFMLISLPVSLIIAWKWEFLGGILIFLSLIGFHVALLFQGGSPEILIFIDIAIIPGILFLLCWYFSRKSQLATR